MNLEIEIEKAKAAVVSYTQHNDIQALNEAIEIYKSILSNNNFIITYNNVVVVVLNGIGIAYWYRYRAIGKLTDLENSIYYYRKAVNLTPDDSPYLPNLLNDLSLGLSVRYASSGELADLEESISLKKKVVKLNPDDYPDLDFPKSLNNLAVGLRDLCLHTGELSYLKSSISYWEKAINMTPKGSYDLLGFFSNLGNGIRELYLLGDKLADLEKSIYYCQMVVNMTPDDSPDLPRLLNNLGNGLVCSYDNSGELADFKQGKQAYEQAAQKGSETTIEWGLKSAINWLQWAFQRQSWQEVTQAYSYAYKSATRLVQTQLLRQHQESWLKNIQGVAADAAYAYAKTEQFELAAVTLERGLAQLLSETLARERVDLEDLKSQRQDLYQAYQDAIASWQQAQVLADIEKLKSAHQKLDTTIAAIRKIKGYEDFLAAPEFKDIAIAAKNTRLVYLLTTDEAGLALIVSDNKLKAVWLPEFKHL